MVIILLSNVVKCVPSPVLYLKIRCHAGFVDFYA